MIKVIAEIGINHESSIDIAKKLIDSAEISNCWAIKFQYRSFQNFYGSTNEIGDELIYDQLNMAYLSLKDIAELTLYAKKKKLKVGISFFTIEDFNEITSSKINFDFYKIPSAEFSNSKLVEKAKSTGKLLLLSTGGHTYKQIKKNIDVYDLESETVILHCTSNYPSDIGSQNLNVIKKLKNNKKIKVGYSSHDMHYEIVFLAAAFGAEYIERHITLNKEGKNLDDSSSSELEEFIKINNILTNFEKILGDDRKPINQGEVLNLQNLGTALYAKKDIKKNKYVTLNDFKIRAPRKGLTYDQIQKYLNKPLIKDVLSNQPITKSHFVRNKNLTKQDFNFMNQNNISLPIRFHDMEYIFDNFKISNYEFHLSYKDVENFDTKLMKSQPDNLNGKTFSYHLPDYLNNYQLFDPLSFTKEIKERSNKLLEKAIKISQVFSSDDENSIIFVSSLSQNNFSNKDEYFKNLSEFINKMFNKYNILFLPQWLPKKAWYFGGSYDISLFSNSDDINFIKKYKMQICLDTAHLIMSANSENENWKNWLDQLLPFTKHIHLSDSYGTDGEGVNFGEGELGNPKKLLAFEGAKVLEVWQGHLNEFKGFKSAVRDLRKFD